MTRPSGKGSWRRGGRGGGRALSTKHPTEHLDQRRKDTADDKHGGKDLQK